VEAARRKLEGSLYDMIISDVRMPGETGVELLALRARGCPRRLFRADHRRADAGNGDCRRETKARIGM